MEVASLHYFVKGWPNKGRVSRDMNLSVCGAVERLLLLSVALTARQLVHKREARERRESDPRSPAGSFAGSSGHRRAAEEAEVSD